jgi:hypothetical protein
MISVKTLSIHNVKHPVIYTEKNEKNIIYDIKNIMEVLTNRNIKVMLSMSDFPEIRNLFLDYNIYDLNVYRGYTKSFTTELLITNYPYNVILV